MRSSLSCERWLRRWSCLYWPIARQVAVHQANGTKALASISDLAVLPPTAAGRFRVALTDAAVRAGARRVEFLRTGGEWPTSDMRLARQANSTERQQRSAQDSKPGVLDARTRRARFCFQRRPIAKSQAHHASWP